MTPVIFSTSIRSLVFCKTKKVCCIWLPVEPPVGYRHAAERRAGAISGVVAAASETLPPSIVLRSSASGNARSHWNWKPAERCQSYRPAMLIRRVVYIADDAGQNGPSDLPDAVDTVYLPVSNLPRQPSYSDPECSDSIALISLGEKM